MEGYIANIEKLTLNNNFYRKVLYTTKNMQLVVMCLNENEDIPEEKHSGSQFIRIESGRGLIYINDVKKQLADGSSAIIPPNAKHYIKNTTKEPLKLYTIYTPPEHKKNTKEYRQ